MDTLRQEGLEEGRQEGRQEEAKSLVLRLLARKLGALPDDVQQQIAQLPLENLEVLGETLFDFEELKDLRNWLDRL